MESEDPKLPAVRSIAWLDGARGFTIRVEVEISFEIVKFDSRLRRARRPNMIDQLFFRFD